MTEFINTSDAKRPSLMKCPGCKQIVDTTKYGNHMINNHKTDLYVAEIPEPAAGPGTGAARRHESFKAWIEEQIKLNFRFFAMWTGAAMVGGWVLVQYLRG